MLRHIVAHVIWAIAAIAAILIVLWSWGWISIPSSQEEERKQRIARADVVCLAQEMWHGAAKGKGTPSEMRLIGQVAMNLHKQTNRSYCAIYESGQAMLPPDRVGDYTRLAEVVGPESRLSTARSGSSAFAEELAHKLLSGDPAAALKPEHAHLACVIKFARSYNGAMWLAVWGGIKTLKKELRAVYGEPVYTDPSGSEFFCPQPKTEAP